MSASSTHRSIVRKRAKSSISPPSAKRPPLTRPSKPAGAVASCRLSCPATAKATTRRCGRGARAKPRQALTVRAQQRHHLCYLLQAHLRPLRPRALRRQGCLPDQDPCPGVSALPALLAHRHRVATASVQVSVPMEVEVRSHHWALHVIRRGIVIIPRRRQRLACVHLADGVRL